MGYPTEGTIPDFTPSADFHVAEGPREIGLCFVGDSFVSGYGDPKALGWVSRVLARTPHAGAGLAAYNLGVRGDTSSDVLHRWRAEAEPRWRGVNEKRLVLGMGGGDLSAGLTTARSRLNLANILDDAATTGIGTYVVGPTPVADREENDRLATLVEAQADVCARRGVTFVDCYTPLLGHDQWQADLATGDGVHPGQAGYGLMAWLVLHTGWLQWLALDES